MKNIVTEGLAGLCMLAVLPSCKTSRQEMPTAGRMERAQAVVVEKDSSAAILVRHTEIPLLKMDALAVYGEMISYLSPEPAICPAEQLSSEKLTAYIGFPAGGVKLDLKYGNNRAELEKLKERLSRLQDGEKKIQSVRLTGFASPDGSTTENERLAGNRAVGFKNYLQKLPELAGGVPVTIDWVGEDWEGLRELVAKSGRSYRTQVLSVLDTYTDADSRRKQLKALEKGTVYKDIEKSFFSRLRRMELDIAYETTVKAGAQSPDLQALAEKVVTDPERLTLGELLQVAVLYRPGTEQYREVYELAAYRFPDSREAVLNAGAASLALGDKEAAAYFLQRVADDPRSWNNLGVLALMENDPSEAVSWFRKAMPQNPRLSRHNIRIAQGY
nr:OmpA family protein [Parabacteroides goldsteinii]